MNRDIRWEQHFCHFQKVLAFLTKAVALAAERPLSDLEEQGLIKSFEYTYELAWNVMKDFYGYQGGTERFQGSQDAIRMALQNGLIRAGKEWMEMVESRIETVHGYDADTASRIRERIIGVYHTLFQDLEKTLLPLRQTPPSTP